jgi:hypothetical protein
MQRNFRIQCLTRETAFEFISDCLLNRQTILLNRLNSSEDQMLISINFNLILTSIFKNFGSEIVFPSK